MNLSDGEKIIILMLTELYEKLKVEGEMEPDFLRSAIFNDMLWGVRWRYPGIRFSEAEEPETVKEVLDILDMWSVIERSYARLDCAGKEAIEQRLGNRHRFQGFDGNNESEYVGIALFLVNQLDRYAEFKGRAFNCHHPSIEMYRRMLGVFNPMRDRLMYSELSEIDLLQVLLEQVHPSKRDG